MLDISQITKGIETILNNDSGVAGAQMLVTRSAYINMLPNATPWVGIYKDKMSCQPHTMGRHNKSWKCTVGFDIYVQAVSYKSGSECEEKLDKYMQILKDALWSDSTLGGTVAQVTGIDTQYTYEKPTDSKSLYFQMAVITLTAEVMTG